jgi:hypothetical protein
LREFEKRKEEATGSCRKLHNEELHNLYSSSSVIRVIKLKRMKWEGYVVSLRR